MRKIICIFQVMLLVQITNCYSQKLVQSQVDAPKLVEQKERFIGRPLKELLDQIQIPIKGYTASRWARPGGALVFMFAPYDSTMKRHGKGLNPLMIRVTVKAPFKWDNRNRNVNEQHLWLKEDEDKYKNLTVANIGIAGEPM